MGTSAAARLVPKSDRPCSKCGALGQMPNRTVCKRCKNDEVITYIKAQRSRKRAERPLGWLPQKPGMKAGTTAPKPPTPCSKCGASPAVRHRTVCTACRNLQAKEYSEAKRRAAGKPVRLSQR